MADEKTVTVRQIGSPIRRDAKQRQTLIGLKLNKLHRVSIKGFEGGQMPLHRRLPKRGFTPPNARDLNEVNLGRIQEAVAAGKLDAGAPVTVETLVAAGVLSKPRDGVKILGVGELTAKLSFEVDGASASARAAIERAGGSVTLRGAAAGAVAEA